MKRVAIALLSVTLAVLLATLVNVRVSLGRKARAVRAAYTQSAQTGPKGPGAYMASVDEYALYLIKIGGKYPVAEEETGALQTLRAAYANSSGPREDRRLLPQFFEAATALTEKLSGQSLSDLDQRELTKYAILLSDGVGKAGAAAGDYNREAEEFNRILRGFPVNLLYRLLGIREAELFQ